MIKSKKTVWARFRWLIVIIIVLLAIFFYFYHRSDQVHYNTLHIEQGSLSQNVMATGSLDAVRKVDVGAQVSGQLKKLYVEVGDRVEKGQLLALIDPQPAENQIREQEADLENLQAQLLQAQAQYQLATLSLKRKTSIGKGNVSQQELDESNTDVLVKKAIIDTINAQITKAKALLDTAKTNLSYTRIVAPMSGQVVNITTLEGQTVIASQQAPTIMTLADLNTMQVKAQVSEADVIHLAPGQKVSFNVLGDPNVQYHAILKDIEPTPILVNNAIFYNARFEVPNKNGVLRLQMTAQVHILLAEKDNVLIMPLAALGERVNANTYRVLRMEKGKPESTEVQLGMRNNIEAEIISGLQKGDEVVLSALDEGQ